MNGFAQLRSFFITAVALAMLVGNSSFAAISSGGNTSANPTSPGADPIIGINNIGRVTATQGGQITSDVVILGEQANGIGLVTITDYNAGTDQASTWTTNSLTVGKAGVGQLEILNGAIVTVDFAGIPGTGDFVVGDAADAIGTVVVSGLGSMLRLGDDTVIAQLGTGTLRIADGGYVQGTNGATQDTDIFTVGLHGRLELAGVDERLVCFLSGVGAR